MSADAPALARLRLVLVVIARNEAHHLPRLLASVRPWVNDALVLDTGSTDNTVHVATACGARVAHFHWVDDFSAARNAALALAGGDWHLVLDADEWLVSGGEALAALCHQSPDFVGQLRVDSQQASGAHTSVAPSWLSRMLPGPVRYSGRVHEQPQHNLRVERLPVVIGHDGYLGAALASKSGRNARLLQLALTDTPDDPYLWYQLGKDHDVYERYAEALSCMDRAATLLQGTPTARQPAWMHDLVVRSLHALKRCKRHAEALQRAEAQMAAWTQSPDYFFALGDLLLDWAADEPARANELVPLIESSWQRCLAIGERPDLEGAVAGRGSHLAAGNLALLCDLQGQARNAAQYRAWAAAWQAAA
ncbi:MAG: glycosyltransferase [Vitreoscilla sp.]|nr:glycosyltransferase [Burkholderiales bacterium]MBP6336651.1 glycosyltransferase [Vitreoscilla sp.]MBP6675276.1 glycosyltransferase [Vitreoscilla sp.]